ncbi:hypothetical protein E6C67_08570 [Azospirillum sp. TSA2s]|uniref:hypothetical protein n=1 Tax=Azospirillum sp. TSA2s TaxID=709810 RepID=UPI0010AB178D|nr:hypothetical protein [Azospirillum sp. TSA2s]QCG93992.1 hypothetical protein E6C67_08570 [Azospirillum sp. TSA2s]
MMRMYGVKGYPAGAEAPSVVLKVRAANPSRAVALASERPLAAGMRLEAVDVGCGLPQEGVFYEGPWPWPGKAA